MKKFRLHGNKRVRDAFRNEDGAIDLSSIMVGIIVIGLIGGTIAATVFVIIPWAQDNAAKQQLDAVVSAQSAYVGLNVSKQSTGYSYGNLKNLVNENLFPDSFLSSTGGEVLSTGGNLCVDTIRQGKGFESAVVSESGNIFKVSDANTKPQRLGDGETACNDAIAAPDAYTDYTMVYNIDTSIAGCSTYIMPASGVTDMTIAWGDGTAEVKHKGSHIVKPSHTFAVAGTYTVKVKGTFSTYGDNAVSATSRCITAVKKWEGSNTTSLNYAFYKADNLLEIKGIPSTTNSMTGAFAESPTFNAEIGHLNVSNVTNMNSMFEDSKSFNQNINDWNVSKVKSLNYTFYGATAFNQPLNEWKTDSLDSMKMTFYLASKFDQPLDKWNTSKVTDMTDTFGWALNFNQNINSWNVSAVKTMSGMFSQTVAFDQPLDNWKTLALENSNAMFGNAKAFNQNIESWDMSKVTSSYSMFMGAANFNQPLNGWKTDSLMNMGQMFRNTPKFDQPLNQWNTSKVTNMYATFADAKAFNQNISGWSRLGNPSNDMFRSGSALTAANSPFGV